ncbi:MAG: hypothetical protein CME69_06135 [Halobacteriovorax sp.]|nr:hypothetical protein [Halobacteriovorax sp.]
MLNIFKRNLLTFICLTAISCSSKIEYEGVSRSIVDPFINVFSITAIRQATPFNPKTQNLYVGESLTLKYLDENSQKFISSAKWSIEGGVGTLTLGEDGVSAKFLATKVGGAKVIAEYNSNISYYIFNISNRPPKIDNIDNILNITPGDLINLNINDEGNDEDRDLQSLSYRCYFDRTPDGVVNEANQCAALTGFNLNAQTGEINWNTDINENSQVEFKVVATDGELQDSKIFIVEFNPIDTDGDGIGDLADLDINPSLPDDDSDGIANIADTDHPSNSENLDTDGDGIIDYFDSINIAQAQSIPNLALSEDTSIKINLPYNDIDGDLATSCTLSSLNNINIISPCNCDINGLCSVEIEGINNYHGTGSFDFTVVTNSQISTLSSVPLNITSVNDLPILSESCQKLFPASQYSCFISGSDVEDVSLDWQKIEDSCDLFNIDSVTGELSASLNTSPPSSCDLTVEASDNDGGKTQLSFTLELISCPTGYIPVAGNSTLTTNGFCVMQFEAKNIGGIATSQASITPWRSISITNARTNCRALGSGYDLISNMEWMTIARDVEKVNSNWSGGSVGSGCIKSGNTGLNSANCSYNGANPESGSSRNTLARLDLSNNYQIWDFSGNLYEFVDWTTGGSLQQAPSPSCEVPWREILSVNCATIDDDELKPLNPAGASNYNSSRGIGRYSGNTYMTGNVVRRGGGYDSAVNAGPFSMLVNGSTSWSNSKVGFRCVYRP